MSNNKLAMCASMSLGDSIAQWRKKLECEGYDVIACPETISGDFLLGYEKEFTKHYEKISESDIVLALNLPKKGVDGYVGAAVFAEIAFAIGLNRSLRKDNPIEVYCLKDFPNSLPYSEEMQFWVDLGYLKFWR